MQPLRQCPIRRMNVTACIKEPRIPEAQRCRVFLPHRYPLPNTKSSSISAGHLFDMFNDDRSDKLHGEVESASKHVEQNAEPVFDPKAEARLRRKIDLMIIPTVSLLYLFCFIDRANIGASCLIAFP